MTESMYGVLKSAAGSKNHLQKSQKEDIGSGIIGAGEELIEGVTGIFKKPVKQAQKSGVKGFFKGLGKGVAGAVTAPVTAALRVGTSVTGEVAAGSKMARKDSEGNLIQNAKRIRNPRYISAS